MDIISKIWDDNPFALLLVFWCIPWIIFEIWCLKFFYSFIHVIGLGVQIIGLINGIILCILAIKG